MRKQLFTIFLLMFMCLGIIPANAAEKSATPRQSIGVVIIGEKDFHQERFYKQAKKLITNKLNHVSIGDTIQTTFKEYCKTNGIKEKSIPKIKDMIGFTKKENLVKLLCIIVRDPIMESFDKRDSFSRSDNHKMRCDLQVDIYILDKEKFISVFSTTKENTAYSEINAKGGAFDKCTNEIKKELKNLL